MLRKNGCECVDDDLIIDYQNYRVPGAILRGNAFRKQISKRDCVEIFRLTHLVPPGDPNHSRIRPSFPQSIESGGFSYWLIFSRFNIMIVLIYR